MYILYIDVCVSYFIMMRFIIYEVFNLGHIPHQTRITNDLESSKDYYI